MSTAALGDAVRALEDAFLAAKKEFERRHPGAVVKPTCVHRPQDEQWATYQIGRRGVKGEKVLTNCDGRKKLSNHNHLPSRAIDFAILFAGKVTWDFVHYREFGEIAEGLGLVWGGRFPIKDGPHVELPKEPA